MEPTEGSETSAFNIQKTGKYPEEYIPQVADDSYKNLQKTYCKEFLGYTHFLI
jgi:hypothetical protein